MLTCLLLWHSSNLHERTISVFFVIVLGYLFQSLGSAATKTSTVMLTLLGDPIYCIKLRRSRHCFVLWLLLLVFVSQLRYADKRNCQYNLLFIPFLTVYVDSQPQVKVRVTF